MAGTAAAGLGLDQDTLIDDVADVAQGGVWRALGDSGPLLRGQLVLESFQQPIHHHLAFMVLLVQ